MPQSIDAGDGSQQEHAVPLNSSESLGLSQSMPTPLGMPLWIPLNSAAQWPQQLPTQQLQQAMQWMPTPLAMPPGTPLNPAQWPQQLPTQTLLQAMQWMPLAMPTPPAMPPAMPWHLVQWPQLQTQPMQLQAPVPYDADVASIHMPNILAWNPSHEPASGPTLPRAPSPRGFSLNRRPTFHTKRIQGSNAKTVEECLQHNGEVFTTIYFVGEVQTWVKIFNHVESQYQSKGETLIQFAPECDVSDDPVNQMWICTVCANDAGNRAHKEWMDATKTAKAKTGRDSASHFGCPAHCSQEMMNHCIFNKSHYYAVAKAYLLEHQEDHISMINIRQHNSDDRPDTISRSKKSPGPNGRTSPSGRSCSPTGQWDNRGHERARVTHVIPREGTGMPTNDTNRSRDVTPSTPNFVSLAPCPGVYDVRFMGKTAITEIPHVGITESKLFKKQFLTRQTWHCFCHFQCDAFGDPRLPLPKSWTTFQSWQQAHCAPSDPFARAFKDHQHAYIAYYVDSAPVEAHPSNGSMLWTRGALRPLWPERCHGNAVRGKLCDACAWLCGTIPPNEYNLRLQFATPPRSPLLSKCSRIERHEQEPEAAIAPAIGLHTNCIDADEAGREFLRQARAETARLHDKLCEANVEASSMQHHLHEANTDLLGCAQELRESAANRDRMLGNLHATEDALSRCQGLVTTLSQQNELLVTAMNQAFEIEDPRALLDLAVQAMGTSGDFNAAQLEFITNWKRRACSKGAQCGELISDLALLAFMDMPAHTYDTFKVFLGLPHIDHASRMREKHVDYIKYTVGMSSTAVKVASQRFERIMTVASADGTRLKRIVSWYAHTLVGRAFPAWVHNWPTEGDPVPGYVKEMQQYLDMCRTSNTLLANEIITLALQNCHGDFNYFIPYGVFPQTCQGFTTDPQVALMLETQKILWEAGIHCCGECDDSCATCHGAGIRLMTPTNDGGHIYWLGLPNIPEFKYWAQLLAQGPCGNIPRTELYFSWHGERLHTERNFRKGVERATTILVTCVLPDNTQLVASLSELKLVAGIVANTDIPYSGPSLTAMHHVKQFRDQEGDSAFAVLTMNTMDIMVRTRGEACYPLLLYQLAAMYLFEVWVNPEFTRPYLMALYLFTSKSLLDTFEAYVALNGLPADLTLLSLTTRKTLDTMAHTGVHHILKMFRKYKDGSIDLDDCWSQISLFMINTKNLESYHGINRCQGNGLSPTLSEWLDSITNGVLKTNLVHRLRDKFKVDIGMARNTRREHQGKHRSFACNPLPESLKDLIGIAEKCGSTEFRYGVQCNPDVVPVGLQVAVTSYEQLIEHLEAGCRYALDINGPNIYRILNPEAVKQFREHRLTSFPVRKHWIRPKDMRSVSTAAVPVACDFAPTGATGVAQQSVPTAGQKVFADLLLQLHEHCNKIRRMPHPAGLRDTVPVTAANGVVTQVPKHMALCDTSGDWHNLTQFLSMKQLMDWVSRERSSRFWVALLPEFKALPVGHNVAIGSILLMNWCTLGSERVVAVVRVNAILLGAAASKSCKLDTSNTSVQCFRVEICVRLLGAQAIGPLGGACFVASGRMYPGLLRAQCISHVVALEGCLMEIVANMEQHEAELFAPRGTRFLDMACLCKASIVTEVDDEYSEADTSGDICCRCSIGWWDNTTGPLGQCHGVCKRYFHSGCLEDGEQAACAQGADWVCSRCNGGDTDLCEACGEEWFDNDEDSVHYTGDMMQCDSCSRWWHQTCHVPNVPNAVVHQLIWHCACCAVGQKPRHNPGPRKVSCPKPTKIPKLRDIAKPKEPKRHRKRGTNPGSPTPAASGRTKVGRLLKSFSSPKVSGEREHKSPVASLPQSKSHPKARTHGQRKNNEETHIPPPTPSLGVHTSDQDFTAKQRRVHDVISEHHRCQLCCEMQPIASLANHGAKCNKEFKCKVPCGNAVMPKERVLPTDAQPRFHASDPMAWEPNHRQQGKMASGSLATSEVPTDVIETVRCQKCSAMVPLKCARIHGPKNNKEFECKCTSACIAKVTTRRQRALAPFHNNP